MRILLPPTFDDDVWPEEVLVSHERVKGEKPVRYYPVKGVKCKQCMFCNEYAFCSETGLYVEPDHYCSWAERG